MGSAPYIWLKQGSGPTFEASILLCGTKCTKQCILWGIGGQSIVGPFRDTMVLLIIYIIDMHMHII